MSAFLAILVLLLSAMTLLVLRLWQPRFSFFWLLAVAAALIAGIMVLIAQTRLPQIFPLVIWQPEELFPISPALLVDQVSWPFAFSIVALTLAAMFSDVLRAARSSFQPSAWQAWSISLTLAGLGLLAVLAGNLITVLLAWAALDLAEIIIWLVQARSRQQGEQVVIAFSGRLAGIIGIMWTGIVAQAQNLPLDFANLTPQTGTYLVISAGLRLGILPASAPLIRELAQQRAVGTLVRLIPAAVTLMLLGRAEFGASPDLAPILLLVIGLAAVYGGLSWVTAADEVAGRPYWTLGMAALALASAVRAQPAAALGWGLATLLPGGLLFLTSLRPRWLIPIHALGLLCITALPYTPTWQGVRLYTSPFNPLLLLFLFAQALLISGYLRHMLRYETANPGAERWIWIFYAPGLALPPVAHLMIAWWSRPGAPGSFQAQPLWSESWPGLVVALIAALFTLWLRRGYQISPRILSVLQNFFSLGWFYRIAGATYLLIRRLLAFISRLLEGQAGILWALLLLILLLSLFVQISMGGQV